jgi:predicted PurR-regulated permease PerM
MAVVTVLALGFFYVIAGVAIVPVLASFGLAYLLDPIAAYGEKRGLSRTLASLGAIVLVCLVVTGFLAYVLPELWDESTQAIAKLSQRFTPENAARQRAILKRYSVSLEKVAGDTIEDFLSSPGSFVKTAVSSAPVTAEGGTLAQGGGTTLVASTLLSSLDLLLVPFFVFYILVDFRRWRTSSEELIPPRFREPFRRLFDESGRILESYVRGQILIGSIMAACYAVCFWLLNVPAWAGISLMAGMLNAIPYVGTVLGIALAGGFTLAHGGSAWDLAWVLGVFLAVQTLEGYVLTPRILGGRLNLHPMAVFLGLLIGGKLFGLMGVILTIPAIAVAKIFLHFLRELYQSSAFYNAGTGEAPHEAPKLEDRVAEAADAVLADQVSKETGAASEQED